jgi:hypothetical protein
VWQQHLDLQFPLTQQLGLDLDAPEGGEPNWKTLYTNVSTTTIDAVWDWEQVYNITVSNSNGDEAARIDDTGISLRMENKSWLKTKVANWIGVKYL